MNPKTSLLELLTAYQPSDEKERSDKVHMLVLAESLANPFSRTELAAHFTGSALIIHPDRQRVCLNFHKKLQRWMHVGGHGEEADQGDIARIALREAHEETGLEVEHFAGVPLLFDVDIHTIPARGSEPEHLHLDLRFLLLAKTTDIQGDPNESNDVRWFSWDEAAKTIMVSLECNRMLKKAYQIVCRS